jgi:hypothetical protein
LLRELGQLRLERRRTSGQAQRPLAEERHRFGNLPHCDGEPNGLSALTRGLLRLAFRPQTKASAVSTSRARATAWTGLPAANLGSPDERLLSTQTCRFSDGQRVRRIAP